MFIRTFDGLVVAIIRARLKSPAAFACLAAIHWRQQRDYHKRPQAITVREFARETRYLKSTVQLALSELETRGIIKVTRGHGASVYEVAFHARWKEPTR
jgi:hypothetical protein